MATNRTKLCVCLLLLAHLSPEKSEVKALTKKKKCRVDWCFHGNGSFGAQDTFRAIFRLIKCLMSSHNSHGPPFDH